MVQMCIQRESDFFSPWAIKPMLIVLRVMNI